MTSEIQTHSIQRILKTKVSISVIMPALNEQKNICDSVLACLHSFLKYGIRGEVLVVNDGSTDGTSSEISKLISEYPELVRVITHSTRKGVGASFWDGVEGAKYDVVVMIPGDNENEPDEIFQYAALLEYVDLVIPFVFNKEVRSLFRNFLSLLYRFIINTTFLVNFNYTNGTVMYRKSMLIALRSRSTGFFFQTDILVRTAKQGYLFAEVPYRLATRSNGKSKALTFPSFLTIVRGYIHLIRDLYFSENRIKRSSFTSDSLSAQRYR